MTVNSGFAGRQGGSRFTVLYEEEVTPKDENFDKNSETIDGNPRFLADLPEFSSEKSVIEKTLTMARVVSGSKKEG